jgi:hypothetical protein
MEDLSQFEPSSNTSHAEQRLADFGERDSDYLSRLSDDPKAGEVPEAVHDRQYTAVADVLRENEERLEREGSSPINTYYPSEVVFRRAAEVARGTPFRTREDEAIAKYADSGQADLEESDYVVGNIHSSEAGEMGRRVADELEEFAEGARDHRYIVEQEVYLEKNSGEGTSPK